MHILFAIMNKCGIGYHGAFYMIIVTFTGEVQFGLKTLSRGRIMIWLVLPLSYCLGTGGFQVSNMMLLSSKHTFSFTVEKLFPNLKRIDVFTHSSVFSWKTWRRSNLRLCWELNNIILSPEVWRFLGTVPGLAISYRPLKATEWVLFDILVTSNIC